MRLKILLIIFFLLSLIEITGASQTYCSDLFGNIHGIVSSSVYNLSTFNTLLSFTGLIIIAVLLVMSLIYGLGVAFGINSFKQFAKTEYIESFVNLLILMFAAGAIFSANGVTSFFSNLSSSILPSSPTSTTTTQITSSSTGIENLYLITCNNIVNVQILTGVVIILGSYLQLVGYQLLQGLSVSFKFSGVKGFSLASLLPSVSFTPFGGLAVIQGFLYTEFSALSGFIGVSIATVLLLFVIYFLFPILFYVGILFRSFPWTRAAGGSLIALFISFFIIFPSILSVFTFATASNILSNISSLCTNYNPQTASGTSSSAISNLCITSSGNNIVAFAQQFGISSLSSGTTGSFILGFLFKNGVGFGANIDLYSEEVAFYVLMLVGLFISFLISYDLLEVFSKLLGSPSFSGKKLFSKII